MDEFISNQPSKSFCVFFRNKVLNLNIAIKYFNKALSFKNLIDSPYYKVLYSQPSLNNDTLNGMRFYERLDCLDYRLKSFPRYGIALYVCVFKSKSFNINHCHLLLETREIGIEPLNFIDFKKNCVSIRNN